MNNISELLDQISSPDDLRHLSVAQLPELCAELRRDIVDELSVNPGHLASSLGVVELTVALHYVFSTPYDRIVWDVGHQAYGHKILTGRKDTFCTNRKLHGIRPFPTSSSMQGFRLSKGSLRSKRTNAKKHWKNSNKRLPRALPSAKIRGVSAFVSPSRYTSVWGICIAIWASATKRVST